MSREIAEEYASSLADLTVNSKPLINMLTILAEENIDHAGTIVETVEKHLEKVSPDIKLPVLYLVDSIIKNVGGAYTQKFSQSIVSMFTKTFKQVDEKVRAQMFKLRETWHDVFPSTKLYQLDVKVNLIDPAWPIQAQPHQSNIHVNPNFLKKQPATVTNSTPVLTEEEEKMRNILARKEQELLLLQRKKIEMELEQARKQLEITEKNVKKVPPSALPVSTVSPISPATNSTQTAPPPSAVPDVSLPVRQRLGPPVNKPMPGARIAPVSGPLAGARRDPRLLRRPAPQTMPVAVDNRHTDRAQPYNTIDNRRVERPVISSVIDNKLSERSSATDKLQDRPVVLSSVDKQPERSVVKRKNVITIDVRPDAVPRDPRLNSKVDKSNNPPRNRNEIKKLNTHNSEKSKQQNRSEAITDKNAVDNFIEKLQIADPKRINKLPPIPKLPKVDRKDSDQAGNNGKHRRENKRANNKSKNNRDHNSSSKDSSSGSSPEKKAKRKEKELKIKETDQEKLLEDTKKPTEDTEVIAFKELKNFNKDHYMRRNKQKSPSPECEKAVSSADHEPTRAILENKDVDLRILNPIVTEPKPATVQKRSSTEVAEVKAKKSKLEKFDILFGTEDVDLRQLPQVEETTAQPTQTVTDSPKLDDEIQKEETNVKIKTPIASPERDTSYKNEREEELKKTPTELDLVRAKLAEATKGKDRLGRPLLFSKCPSVEKDLQQLSDSEDAESRLENPEDFDAEDHKKTISIIMSQAKEQFSDGKLDKSQYNTLMYQVFQLVEKLKLKEAKQQESLELSKRKLKAHVDGEKKIALPKLSPSDHNTFGDIDERINPVFIETPPSSQNFNQDSDMRMPLKPNDMIDSVQRPVSNPPTVPLPPMMPMFPPMAPFPPMWAGAPPRHLLEDFGPGQLRPPVPPFFRPNFDKRPLRPPYDPVMPLPLPAPKLGMCQGKSPLIPYERCGSPPPIGAPGVRIPPTDFRILEYIEQDPVKSIQIDGVPREIRFYGEVAVIMLEWDDPREITFLPGSRRVTFDNKDSIVLSFNEGYKQVEIDDQVFDIRFGAPTRELYINGKWFECFFGGQPFGVMIDNKPRLIHLEGPLPQVDIGKVKRTDLVAGKINLIVDATHMCSLYLDAKVQKFQIKGKFFTIRFVDSLRTVLINEQPFKLEFGGLPRPLFIGNEKHFIRFSVLPRSVKQGYVNIVNMEGSGTTIPKSMPSLDISRDVMEVDQNLQTRFVKSPSPESQGLDMLASLMPSNTAPSSGSEYTSAEPLFLKTDKIPGLETQSEEQPINEAATPLANINVNDLFSKLVATGIIKVPEAKSASNTDKAGEAKTKQKEDKSVIHHVDLLKSETLRVKQPGLVARLYGGMQCGGCGARFPPERTVRYSQHLDWHFRKNRRERESARRAHSRHWHYDLPDWLQYEEVEDLDEREKSWFETNSATETGSEAPPETTEEASVPAGAPVAHTCTLCGDAFDQFYNEDKEEWHLRNAVSHDNKNYHPLCFQDYKASLAKEEPPAEVSLEEITEIELDKDPEPIEIRDLDEEENIEDDNESVVEVIESEQKLEEPVEIDEGDEDDVVMKAEPIVQVEVQDDYDTDDETQAERTKRDEQAKIDFANIKIKQEPVDPDDEPVITAEEEAMRASADTTQATVISTIDGNLQLSTAPVQNPVTAASIRINITKAIPASVSHEERRIDQLTPDDEPLPPGEEPELEYKLKPSLEGVHLSRQPPTMKGNELSGLCSIM